jgi:CRISPR-associated protein Cas5t
MRVAKVRILAPTASFRYPHFLVGKQITYSMPPPSTIYGHVASAVGQLPPPETIRFAYHFVFTARGVDLEHQHIVSTSAPDKLSKEQAANFKRWRAENRLALGGAVQPVFREFLFQAELTLYLTPSSLAQAFRTPVFPVVLGRSQDVACVVMAEEIELPFADGAYFENTLLPFSWRARTARGITVLMPRYIGPPPDREPTFAQYVVLRAGDRLYSGNAAIAPDDRRRLVRKPEPEQWPVDPDTPLDKGVRRGLVFHSFADG